MLVRQRRLRGGCSWGAFVFKEPVAIATSTARTERRPRLPVGRPRRRSLGRPRPARGEPAAAPRAGNAGSAAWVSTSSFGGGPVDGDDLRLDVEVAAGASALLATQASTKAYRGSARSEIHARVGEGATLVVLSDPLVPFAGSRVETLLGHRPPPDRRASTATSSSPCTGASCRCRRSSASPRSPRGAGRRRPRARGRRPSSSNAGPPHRRPRRRAPAATGRSRSAATTPSPRRTARSRFDRERGERHAARHPRRHGRPLRARRVGPLGRSCVEAVASSSR